MFEQLRDERRIAVTGPQRSGTRIAAQMIAADAGLHFVDEAEFDFIDEAAWRELLFEQEGVVVQCPAMLKPLVDERRDDVLVVLMRRPLEEIYASQSRVEWKQYEIWELGRFGLSEGDSAAIKYEYWDSQPKPPRAMELDYASLSQHPRFVPSGQRTSFGPHQTSTT